MPGAASEGFRRPRHHLASILWTLRTVGSRVSAKRSMLATGTTGCAGSPEGRADIQQYEDTHIYSSMRTYVVV